MLIAQSAAGENAARAFARAHPAACELFAEVDAERYLAIVPGPLRDEPNWTFTIVTPLFDGGTQGPTAGEWLFHVGFHVPTQDRDDFLAWYRGEHLPILLECAAWGGCRFVEARAATGCQFFALHQLRDRDALASPERARSRATPWFERLKRNAWFDEPFTRTLYRRFDPRPRVATSLADRRDR